MEAAEQKQPEALDQLGCCAEDGNGMQRDDRAAAEAGYAQAQYAYSICLPADIFVAVLTVIWTIVVIMVKGILMIAGIVVVLWVLGNFWDDVEPSGTGL